jgi:hypothetical protein
MTKVKEMPYKEKYAKVIDNIKFDHAFIVPFVQKHLGDQAVIEIKKTWEEGMKPIPKGTSFEKKYEIAYANWIWLAKQIYLFIRQRMGKDVNGHQEVSHFRSLKLSHTHSFYKFDLSL